MCKLSYSKAHVRLPIVFGLAVVVMFVLRFPQAAAQNTSEENTIYITTLNQGLFLFNTETGTFENIFQYDYENLRYLTFSYNRQSFAYIRYEGNQRYIGISLLNESEPSEILLDIPVEFNNIYLTWFPSDKYLVITYTNDIVREVQSEGYTTQYTEYNVVVWRQLVTLGDSIEWQEWPYRCTYLGDNEEFTAFFLECNYDDTLHILDNSDSFPSYALYGFESGILSYQATGIRILAMTHDIERPSWLWSPQRGVIVQSGNDQLGERTDGLYQLQHTYPFLNLIIGQPSQGARFLLSPEATQILVETGLLTWQIVDFDPLGSAVIDIPRHNAEPGVIWVDENHIGYATGDSSDEIAIHVRELSTGTERVFPFPYDIFRMTSVHANG